MPFPRDEEKTGSVEDKDEADLGRLLSAPRRR